MKSEFVNTHKIFDLTGRVAVVTGASHVSPARTRFAESFAKIGIVPGDGGA